MHEQTHCCACFYISLSFINMKYFLLLVTMMILPTVGAKMAQSNAPLSGVDAYTVYPKDVLKEVVITFPYYTSEKISLTYRYDVFNPQGVKVYSQNQKVTTMLADSRLLLTYTAPKGVTGVGHNRLFFYYQASHHETVLTHYLSFYGYQQNVAVDLNDHQSAVDHFSKEITFEYTGYLKRTVIYHQTTLYPTTLTGYVYIPTDLCFDLNLVQIRIKNLYVAPFVREAILYCEDATLFPLMTKIYPNRVGFKVGIRKEGNVSTLFLLRPLYVDKVTLLTVDEPRNGFIPTDKIYFPMSRMGGVHLTPFSLELSGFGFHEYHVSYRFKLEVGTPFLGEGGLFEPIIDRY